MSPRLERFTAAGGACRSLALALLVAGCQRTGQKVDPRRLYGSWAPSWPRFEGSPGVDAACAVGADGVSCGWVEVQYWETEADERSGETAASDFGVDIGITQHNCVFPWSVGATSSVRWVSLGGSHVGEMRANGDIVFSFFSFAGLDRDLVCSLIGPDTMICTDWDLLQGQGPFGEYTLQRVDRTSVPVLCDRLLEEALLVSDVRLPGLGDP